MALPAELGQSFSGLQLASHPESGTPGVDKTRPGTVKEEWRKDIAALCTSLRKRFCRATCAERRTAPTILDILNRDGRVLVGDLAKQFRTSQVTIRKDLDILQAHGRIHRTHGGALPARESALEDPTLREKEKLHRKEKLQIAAAAARMVQEGQVVILDSGTTTTAIARALREFENLTIITNAVNIAAELSGSSLEVILTGGTLRKNSFSLVGPIAEETLRRLNADILFLWEWMVSTCTTD